MKIQDVPEGIIAEWGMLWEISNGKIYNGLYSKRWPADMTWARLPDNQKQQLISWAKSVKTSSTYENEFIQAKFDEYVKTIPESKDENKFIQVKFDEYVKTIDSSKEAYEKDMDNWKENIRKWMRENHGTADVFQLASAANKRFFGNIHADPPQRILDLAKEVYNEKVAKLKPFAEYKNDPTISWEQNRKKWMEENILPNEDAYALGLKAANFIPPQPSHLYDRNTVPISYVNIAIQVIQEKAKQEKQAKDLAASPKITPSGLLPSEMEWIRDNYHYHDHPHDLAMAAAKSFGTLIPNQNSGAPNAYENYAAKVFEEENIKEEIKMKETAAQVRASQKSNQADKLTPREWMLKNWRAHGTPSALANACALAAPGFHNQRGSFLSLANDIFEWDVDENGHKCVIPEVGDYILLGMKSLKVLDFDQDKGFLVELYACKPFETTGITGYVEFKTGSTVVYSGSCFSANPDNISGYDELILRLNAAQKYVLSKTYNISENGKISKMGKQEDNHEESDENSTFMLMIKKNGEKALYQSAATTMTKAAQSGLILAMREAKMDDAQINMFENLLNTPIGNALIAMLLGVGLNYAPVMTNDPRKQKLSDQFQVNGMSVGMDVVTGIVMKFLTPAMNAAIKALPPLSLEEKVLLENNGKLRVKSTKNRIDSESSDEDDPIVNDSILKSVK